MDSESANRTNTFETLFQRFYESGIPSRPAVQNVTAPRMNVVVVSRDSLFNAFGLDYGGPSVRDPVFDDLGREPAHDELASRTFNRRDRKLGVSLENLFFQQRQIADNSITLLHICSSKRVKFATRR
jgi:hypothetical protein